MLYILNPTHLYKHLLNPTHLYDTYLFNPYPHTPPTNSASFLGSSSAAQLQALLRANLGSYGANCDVTELSGTHIHIYTYTYT
jgi:hypothetical protein